MPEELSANIKELAEKKEEAKGDEVETTEEPPHKWTIRDDVKIIGIIVFMYAILALMFYLAVTLMKHVDECRVCSKQRKSVPGAPSHCTSSSTAHCRRHPRTPPRPATSPPPSAGP